MVTESSVDALVAERNEIAKEIARLTERRREIDAALAAMARVVRPEVETSGTVDLAGSQSVANVGFDRDWDWSEPAFRRLQSLELLTPKEFDKLATWVLKVDGRFYNKLLRRGGELAEELGRCRTLAKATPRVTTHDRGVDTDA